MLLPIAAAVIVLAALAIGYRDVGRFRLRRVRAIAGVCFAESIRRKILWITPLAIVGVVAVSQFARPADEQDAIRQTLKYSLFAAGLIVIVAAVILAATNLPREIESRVIFTIVTKPTTRLEIVLGKVAGFASVSAAILLIMGLFTYGYLSVRSAAMVRSIRQSLEAGTADPQRVAELRVYAQDGLLNTRALEWPARLQIYSREPDPDGTRWMGGGRQQFYTVPFHLSEQEVERIVDLAKHGNAVYLSTKVKIDRHEPSADERADLEASRPPIEGETLAAGPQLPVEAATRPTDSLPLPAPQVSFAIFNIKSHSGIAADLINATRTVFATDAGRPAPLEGMKEFRLPLDPAALVEVLAVPDFYVEVNAATTTIDYGVDANSTALIVVDPRAPGSPPLLRIAPSDPRDKPEGVASAAAEPEFFSRFGRVGMQIRGQPPEEGEGSVGIFHFNNASVDPGPDGRMGLQLKLAVERGGDLDAVRIIASKASIQVRNRQSGMLFGAGEVEPETSRLSYAQVPAEAVAGGDFDVLIRGRTPGQWLGLHGPESTTPSVALVKSTDSFAFNLAKSLFLLWLLSVLVVIIAIFCSTFLSWPIAIVLTLMLLLGRWGVDQLGEAIAAGSERSTVQDIFNPQNQAARTALTGTVGGLSTALRTIATVLPDVTTFPVIEDIGRGVSIPRAKVLKALGTVGWYGVPLVMLTYLILRRKEVAP